MSSCHRHSGLDEEHLDPFVLAAMVAFGFCLYYPFMVGTAVHRYLIHHILAPAGLHSLRDRLTVSAVFLANLERYVECLEMFLQTAG